MRHDLLPAVLIESFLLNGESDVSLANELKQVLKTVPVSVIQERMRTVIGSNVIQDVRGLRVPVLYLQATHDRLVRQRSVSEIKQSALAATVVQITAPHMILQTRPAACATAIGAWLMQTRSL